MATYNKIIDLIEKSKDIAVFMHANPDGDCLGSAIALTRFLNKKGKRVFCFAPDLNKSALPVKVSFFGYEVITDSYNGERFDLSIGVDLGSANLMGDACFRIFLKGKKSIVIDHHSEHTDFADVTVREKSAASTTQILYKILAEYDKSAIDEKIAECLYTGLVTDSGGFSFSCTTSETHFVAGELLKYNIDCAEINRIVMKDIPLNVFHLKNRVLSGMKLYEEGHIAVICFTKEDFEATGTNEKNTEGIINSVLNVIGVELAVSISETSDKCYKVSFRSKHNVDASACAKCFGGGGHFHASGCRVYGYFEDVYDKIISSCKEIYHYA